MAETIRAYYVIDTGAPRTQNQWDLLKTAVKNKPMLLAIRTIGDTYNLPHMKAIDNRFSLDLRYCLVRFCVDQADQASLVATLNIQATLRSCTGTARQKFACVIQAELREAATDLGYGGAAAGMTFTEIGYGDRDTAIAGAQAYITANTANWNSIV